MARNEAITISRTPTLLTDSDVSALSFQVLTDNTTILLQATADTTAPDNSTFDGFKYRAMDGQASLSLAEHFPGITGAARVWASIVSANRSEAQVFVSHA